MNRFAVILVLAFACIGVHAQDFDRVARGNLWNDGVNVAGIRQDRAGISNAEIYASFEDGKFRSGHEGRNVWSAGASARSIVHFDKISLAGSFGFMMKDMKDACGSMFVAPGSCPVDIMEFTPGRKTLQEYSFTGKIAYDLGDSWRIGGGIDFASTNYAKRKDLRYTDYRLDLGATASALWHKDRLAVGLSYTFGRYYEMINAEVIGTKFTSYYAFLDKGLMYGAYEMWNGDGVHLKGYGVDVFPVKENSHKVALSAQQGDFWEEVAYTYGRETVGEKQILWYLFPSHGVSAKIGWLHGRHSARLAFDWKILMGDEGQGEKVMEGGVTINRIFAYNRIYGSRSMRINPEYEYVAPSWEVLVRANVDMNDQMSMQMYPYVFGRKSLNYDVDLSGKYRVWHIEISAGVDYRAGLWEESTKNVSEGLAPALPARHEEYYKIQKEFETTGRIAARLGVKYDIYKGLYVGLYGNYTHAFKVVAIAGWQRWSAGFRLGYTF